MKLSLCIATFNEEQFVHYPLDSAYDLVDEVIIVDGGSTDKTVETAKKYGDKVKVFTEENPKMFHINKQKAIERAKGEWILQLDADEALSEELKGEIRTIIFDLRSQISDARLQMSDDNRLPARQGPQITEKKSSDIRHQTSGINCAAYRIPRKNFFLGRFLMKGGVYPDYTIRLYKNGKARFPCKTVHENVEVDGEVGYLQSPIVHYADPDFGRYLKRWHRYTALDAGEIKRNGKNVFFFDYFFVKPLLWFLSSYVRHKGFMDGWQGFVFSFFSSIRFWAIYFKAIRH